MTVSNTIEREVILKGNIEQVWDAITNPEKLSQWFGDHAEIPSLQVGEPLVFGWEDDICKGIIHIVDKPTTFAFYWQSSRLGKTAQFQQEYATLVTFTLTSVPTGTHLHVLETGFAHLPDEIIDASEPVAKPLSNQELQVNTEQPLSMLTNPVQKVDSPELTLGSADNGLSHAEEAYKDNVSGWRHELADLEAYFDQDSA